MRAEALVELFVSTLAEEVEVERPQRRREGVGVAHAKRVAVGVVHVELVGQRQRGTLGHAREQAVRVDAAQLDRGTPLRVHEDRLGVGPIRADAHPGARGVGAEDVMRIGVVARDQPLDLGLAQRHRCRPGSPAALMPASAPTAA